jgi:hypothetical protein
LPGTNTLILFGLIVRNEGKKFNNIDMRTTITSKFHRRRKVQSRPRNSTITFWRPTATATTKIWWRFYKTFIFFVVKADVVPGPSGIKLFVSVIYILSWKNCWTRLVKLARDKSSSVVQKFYDIEACTIKLITAVYGFLVSVSVCP